MLSYTQAIGRVLTLDATEDQGRFDTFMQPFSAMCRAVSAEMHAAMPNFQQLKVCISFLTSFSPRTVLSPLVTRVQVSVLGLARDLRGIVAVCGGKPSYVLFYEWLYPEHISVCPLLRM
jgi:hypothetical protein